jgi:hypothetical protein
MKILVSQVKALWRQRQWFCMGLLAVLSLLFGFLMGEKSAALPATGAVAPPSRPALAGGAETAHRESLRWSLLKMPAAEEESPFWMSAVVPEPENFRMPSAAVVPIQPSPPDVAQVTAARVRELEHGPVTPDGVHQLNQQVILWYDQDAAAATEWLNTTGRFEELSPSLASIAAVLGERGHFDAARLVLENISDPEAKRTAVLELFSLQARNGRVTREGLAAEGWQPADIDQVFQGD